MALCGVFHHPFLVSPGPSTRVFYLGLNWSLNPHTPFLDHIVPIQATPLTTFDFNAGTKYSKI